MRATQGSGHSCLRSREVALGQREMSSAVI
jgi:hypothetical protein